MEDTNKLESQLTSAAAFVEGGIQDACDDACSICLESFCDSDPSTVTNCMHEFHLQCILEWCQRSSQCPMCWQPINLKDPASQELLEAVERERSFRFNPSRNATIFHHPTLGNFELDHLPMGVNDAELEERIVQHLAAAMGRRHIFKREGQRNRSIAQAHPQFLEFSSHLNAPAGRISSSPNQRGVDEPVAAIAETTQSSPSANVGGESLQSIAMQSSISQANLASSSSGSNILASNQHEISLNNRSLNQSSLTNQDRASGLSESQSFSESIKSKLNVVSTRYKESIAKGTRGWKERFFSHSTTMADLGSEVRREVNAGIAIVSRMMERLETRNDNRSSTSSNSVEDSSVTESNNQQISETGGSNPTSNMNTHA